MAAINSTSKANIGPTKRVKHNRTKPREVRKTPEAVDGPGAPSELPSVLHFVHPGVGGNHLTSINLVGRRGCPLKPKARRIPKSSTLLCMLRRHLEYRCPEFKLVRPNGKSPKCEYVFDQESCRRSFAVAVIKHNYPFKIVEHKYFLDFLKKANPDLDLGCRATLRKLVNSIYEEEKANLLQTLETQVSRVSLTTDVWTSDHSGTPYYCVTLHYIDDNWTLNKKIIAFKTIPYPHTGQALFEVMRNVIQDWKIEKKLGSIVVDNASANDVMIERVKEWFYDDLCLNGELLHVRCSAHIMNLVVQDGLKVIKGLIWKLRESVRILERSPLHAQMFETAKRECKLGGFRDVAPDVPNRWNSTYTMLETALPLKPAFEWWANYDGTYKHNPSEEEWEVAKVVFGCLKPFFQSTTRLSGTMYPTSNLAFIDICDIHVKLLEWKKSRFQYVKDMADPMLTKFLKYWEEVTLVLAVATVLDPRFKMQIVEYYYSKIYGDEASYYVDKVRNILEKLFIAYGGCIGGSGSGGIGDMNSDEACPSTLYEVERWCRASSVAEKSELEKYLSEEKFNSVAKLDVLDWWHQNSNSLPIMAKIARDVLGVPAATVASESAFSIGGKIISESRSKLLGDAVESLMAGRDWIRYLSGSDSSDDE